MRLIPYDPEIDLCKNCFVWKRADGVLGVCRLHPPVVTHFQHVIMEPGAQGRIGIKEATVSGWPSTREDQSCYEHVPLPPAAARRTQ